jgi:hypothetical protein
MIIQYLVCTSDTGTIAKLTGSLLIDCYVNADFVSLFSKDPGATQQKTFLKALHYIFRQE